MQRNVKATPSSWFRAYEERTLGVIAGRTRPGFYEDARDEDGLEDQPGRCRIGSRCSASPAPRRAAEYANVISATPVTGSVAAPRQECAEGERVVQPQPSGAGAVIGAIAGGVVGNQFGHGFGRAAATGLGAVAGSAIGNNVEANANPPADRARAQLPHRQRLREPRRRLRRRLRVQRPALHDPRCRAIRAAPRDRRAPGGDAPLDRVGARSYGAVPPAYAQAAPATATRRRLLRRAARLLRAGAGLLLGPAPYYVAPAAIGFGIGYWAGQHVASRLSPLAASRPADAERKKGPAGSFFLERRDRAASGADPRDDARHLEHLVRVAPLVVVPGDDLDEGRSSAMPASASNTEVIGSPRKSVETTLSSV